MNNEPNTTNSTNGGNQPVIITNTQDLNNTGINNGDTVNSTPTLVSSSPISNSGAVSVTNPVITNANPVGTTTDTGSVPVANPMPKVDANGVVNESQIPTPSPVIPTTNTGNAPVANPMPKVDANGVVNESQIPTPNLVNSGGLNGNSDNNGVVQENLKNVEIDYKPLSKFKVFVLILFFVGLIAFVLFLPEISLFIDQYKTKEVKEEKIVDGKLRCSLESTTSNLTNNYNVSFEFHDNKAEKLRFVTEVKGSTTEDTEALDKMNEECKLLKNETKSIKGIEIGCDYTEGLLEKKQIFDLANVDFESLEPIYAESGGTLPEYRFGDNMDNIEKSMNAAGYTCVREH